MLTTREAICYSSIFYKRNIGNTDFIKAGGIGEVVNEIGEIGESVLPYIKSVRKSTYYFVSRIKI